METCRVLSHLVGDGPTNMGLDEALLDEVAEGRSGAVVRTYGWSEPTLSLGYFQAIARAEADPRWRGATMIRRPTGGGALWHDREITYALVIPASHPLAKRHVDLYRVVHQAIAQAIRATGLNATRRGDTFPKPPGPKPLLCFADHDAEDVVSGQVKLVGSAQRRRAGAVLQHGALLLARSTATPELPGLDDLKGSESDPLAWAKTLGQIIPQALELEPVKDDATTRLLQHAANLAQSVYRNPAWTRKR
jgi:lipoate-protein ligase A